jgi:phage gp46-like protein
MGDIRMVFNAATFSCDFAMAGPGLVLGNELESAVLISLFTDALADPEDLLPPGQAIDRRGWWADSYENEQIGSKLWQVFWRQTTQDTLNWARDTALKALQWMLDDQVASDLSVDVQFLGKGRMGIDIVITEPSGQRSPFSYAWQQEG